MVPIFGHGLEKSVGSLDLFGCTYELLVSVSVIFKCRKILEFGVEVFEYDVK